MRNYITSSIANVICRCNSAVVDMLRMVSDPASYQWHVQHCTKVQKPSGLRPTGGVNALSSGTSSIRAAFERLERLFVETTGGNELLCPCTTGSSGSPRVS